MNLTLFEKIKTSGPDVQRYSGSRRYGEDRCETLCDENGCHCLLDNDVPLRLIDHIMVSPFQGGRIACFCGHFAVNKYFYIHFFSSWLMDKRMSVIWNRFIEFYYLRKYLKLRLEHGNEYFSKSIKMINKIICSENIKTVKLWTIILRNLLICIL